MDRQEAVSRRTVIRLAGVATGTALVAGCAGPDDGNGGGNGGGNGEDNGTEGEDGGIGNGEDNETDGGIGNGEDNETDGEDNETEGEDNETEGNETDGATGGDGEWQGVDEVVLDGYTEAWEGVEPSPIEGEDNPTLVLTEGESYDITWTNADGQPHNIEIWDDNEEVVDDYDTEIIEEEGEEQTLTIDEVTDEMAEYVCEVHVGTMSGEIDVQTGDGGGGEGNETAGGDNETGDNETGDNETDGL